MKTLHIAPGHSAGGSLRQAIRGAGRDDDVLAFPDDLSCGPIDRDEPTRAAWWDQIYDAYDVEPALSEFWERVAATDRRIVVWFGRHAARELAFFLAWIDRLGERPYQVIDVTGRQVQYRRRDGSVAVRLGECVSELQPDALRTFLGSEGPIAPERRKELRRHWRQLRAENAPFRIVTDAGLTSAPLDYFDPWILQEAAAEWRSMAYVVGGAMVAAGEPYHQVGDLMLQARVVALIGEGKLLAEGDPWVMRSCRIRLPG